MKRVACVWLLAVSACGKPRIEPDCFMNGLGKGECYFANVGDGDGTLCGHIVVTRPGRRPAFSTRFCSGEVARGSVTRFGFLVADAREMCATEEGLWFDACGFTFKSEQESLAPAKVRTADRGKLAESLADRMCACHDPACVRDMQKTLDEVGQHQDQDPARAPPDEKARVDAAKTKLKACAAAAAPP